MAGAVACMQCVHAMHNACVRSCTPNEQARQSSPIMFIFHMMATTATTVNVAHVQDRRVISHFRDLCRSASTGPWSR